MEDNGELDRLYVLQLRAAVVAELTSNLHAFSIPLDDWLRDHEAKSRRLMRPMVHPFIIRLKCDILRRRELNERKRRKLFSHYSRSDRVLSPERC